MVFDKCIHLYMIVALPLQCALTLRHFNTEINFLIVFFFIHLVINFLSEGALIISIHLVISIDGIFGFIYFFMHEDYMIRDCFKYSIPFIYIIYSFFFFLFLSPFPEALLGLSVMRE